MNPILAKLQPYPFEKLRALYAGIEPNAALLPIECTMVDTWATVGSVVLPGPVPSADGKYGLYCAVIAKQVDAKTRAKTGINELLSGE